MHFHTVGINRLKVIVLVLFCFVKFKNSIIAFLEALFCGYTVYESEVDETEIIKKYRNSFFGKEYRQFKDMRIKPHEQAYLKNKKHALKEKGEGGGRGN